MPEIIDYEDVLGAMERLGLRCVYHNSGAFGFRDESSARSIGWIGPEDETIRPEARPLVRRVRPPFEQTLSRMFAEAWRASVGGPVWLMPASHWAYELQFGNREWLPDLLRSCGIDPAMMEDRNDACAVAFSANEAGAVAVVVQELLAHLSGSDFAAAFPEQPTICRIHHHRQLWWTTANQQVLNALESAARTERRPDPGQ